MEKKKIFGVFVCDIVPVRNYLFKVSNLSIRITCESSSMLRMSILTIFNINDVSGVVLVSLLLTVNIFQTFFLLLTLNWQTFDWFISKRQTYLKTRSGISCFMYYFKCEQIAFELIPSQPYGWIREKFLRRSLLQNVILAKKMQLTFKMTCCMCNCLFTDFAC